MGKNITRKKGNRKQNHLSYNINGIEKNSKWGRTENLGEKINILKKGGGKENQAVRNFIQYTHLLFRFPDWISKA